MPIPRFEQHREHIDVILAAVWRSCDPRPRVAEAVRKSPPRATRPGVIAVGKAAPAMLRGFRDAFTGPHEAIVVVPEGVPAPPGAIVSDHPYPTPRCVGAAQRVAAFVEKVSSGVLPQDGFVVLLSGGASALLAWPYDEISIKDYAIATEEMLGLKIGQLNAIRKHCERLKGGKLAALMSPLPCDNYLLSDVIGDDPSTIGSGPTVPDPTTYKEACEPFDWALEFTHAASVLYPLLKMGERWHPETPKPGDPVFEHVRTTIVGSNSMAIEAAAGAARQLGFQVMTCPEVEGDAEWAGRELARDIKGATPPAAVIYGGETRVLNPGRKGKGGRNQEAALAAAIEISGGRGLAIAAFATDGVDGPTDAAGAVVTGGTRGCAEEHGLDALAALNRHDSYTFFGALERAGFPHLIRTGPTGTNANDILIALAY